MTWFRVGGAGIPATLKNAMNAVFNKKFGTSGQNYPPKQWPDDVNLLGPLPEGTATGSIANFSDGADDVPLKSCEVALPASLDGYSSVDVVNTGKNFLDDTLANLEQGSINGSNGNNENANNRVRSINAIPFPYDKIASSYSWTIPNGYKVAIRPYDKDGNFVQLPSWALAFITQLPTDLIGQGITQMKFVFAKIDNTAITPSDIANVGFQIEVGSTASTYEPYTAPTTHTVSLGRTIYGGQADIVNGEGQETHAKIDMGDLTWQYDSVNTRFFTVGLTGVIKRGASGWITDLAVSSPYTVASGTGNDKTISEYASTGYVYIKDTDYTDPTAFKTSLSGKYLTYPIATPTDFTFDGQEINSLYGVNNFWNNAGGDTTVVYRRDIDLALQAVSSSRGLMMASRPVTQLIGEESDPDQVNEHVENDETEQEGEDNAR